MKAKTIAAGKCYSCGLAVSVAEADAVMNPQAGKHMVLHDEPTCAAFHSDDPDVYARRCGLQPLDPIAEALKDMIK